MSSEIENDRPDEHPAATAGNEHSDSDQNITLVIELPETPPQRPPSHDRKQRTESRSYLFSQWGMVILTLGAICVAIRSLDKLTESVDTANRQAAAAATQAGAAMRSAEAAEKANRDNLAEFRLSERPWVDITDIRAKGPLVFDSAKSAHIDVEATTVNGGRSTAVNEGSNLDLIISVGNVAVDRENRNYCEPTTPAHVAVFHVWTQSDVVLLPNIPFVSEWQLHTVNEPITPPTNDGKYGVYIAACFGYSNQFGASFMERRLWVFVTTDDQQLFLPQGSIQGHFERTPSGAPILP